MRLFTGIDLPEEIKNRLDVLISHLRTHAHIKWSPAYNLHVTTKFIGEWPQDRLGELDYQLKGVRVESALKIRVEGLGWFPNARNPRVFWAGIQATETLSDLAHRTEQNLAKLGIAMEDRAYSPHLTLARVREATPLESLRMAIEKLPGEIFGEFTPSTFSLYRSETGHAGSVYSKLQEYALPTT